MKTIVKLIGGIAAVCILGMGAPSGLRAQGYGSINGTVTDSTGAVVPGAEVTATQAGTGITVRTTTGGEGTYVIPTLAPSVYNISASHPGFETYTEKALQLRADNALTINITLKAGSTGETVTVNAEPAQVDTTTGTLEQVIGTAQVNDLPLNGRNAAALTEDVAGVTVAPPASADQGDTKTFPTAITISANGTFVGQTNFMLDGGNNVDEYTNVNQPFPMPDALQEFSIETNNYSAQYGQNAGGVVNIITKSGTSQWHGDLFEYVRNSDLNAAVPLTWSTKTNANSVDLLHRNQFGGTIGGPLSIPHVLKTNKLFGFFAYQKTIDHEAATSAGTTLPTIAQAGANSSGGAPGTNNLVFTDCVIDPLMPSAILTSTITCPAGESNTWSSAALSPVTANFFKYVPALTTSGSVLFSQPSLFGYGEITARVDDELTPMDKLTVRYFSDEFILQGVENLSDILSLADGASNHLYNSLVSETHTFNNHIVNNFILSYQHQYDIRGPSSSSLDVDDLGSNIWQPAFKQINEIQVSNLFTISVNPQAAFVRNNYTLTDDIHFLMGRHNIDAGYHGELSKIDVNNDFEQPGEFFFNSNVTPDPAANFVFGNLSELIQASGEYFNVRGKFQGAYVQDSWKATRNLTVNYGVRYEPFIPWHNLFGRMGGFNPTLWASGTHSTKFPLAPAGLQFAGDPGFIPNGVANEYDHFMPRVGFAWDVFGNGKTALRGGGGMFYDSRINSTLFDIYSTGSPPFLQAVTLQQTATTPINWANPYGTAGVTNPFPSPQPPPNTVPISSSNSWLTFDPYKGFQDPRDYAWNLAVEQQVTGSLSARVAYVATHGSHEWEDTELNPNIGAVNGVGGTLKFDQPGCSTTNSCFPNYITAANTGGNTNYNSLQLSAEQRVRYGLTLLFNYTWSKALNDMPWNQAATSIGGGGSYVYPVTMPNYKALDYGPADFDHRNITALSYVYTVPKVLNDSPGAVRYILNGWGTGGIIQYHSGDPLTIWSSSANNSGTHQNRDRAVYSGSGAYGSSACAVGAINCRGWLNPAAFSVNPPGTFGNVVKGSFVGPHYVDWDGNLTRKFAFTERTSLVFEADYFNLFNHTNLGDPGTTLTAAGGTFGKITSTSPQNWTTGPGSTSDPQNSPRIAQLSLKLIF
ncbi:MAG TPA: carboxypeptidase regulatory-like domain-containing protein [Terracidiphilus sp.]|nr:carboxypeptidase regulatory-like domain-containing protein [Terracidiphilus sp.]